MTNRNYVLESGNVGLTGVPLTGEVQRSPSPVRSPKGCLSFFCVFGDGCAVRLSLHCVSLRLYDTPHYYIQFYCHTIWLFLFFSKTTTFPYDSASSLSLSLNCTTVSHQSGSCKPQDLVSVLTALERP